MNNLEKYGVNEFFINQAKSYPHYKLARIIAQYRNRYKVATNNSEILGEISGKFRYNTDTISNYPAIGDFVLIQQNINNTIAKIELVLQRKSFFERTAVGNNKQKQIVAANIDIVFVCMSLNNNYNLNRLERYLSIAWDSGAIPVIILTKSDLCENLSEILFQIENVAVGVDILVTSAFDETTIAKLNIFLKKGITSSFIGSSGVGKTTLINKLIDKSLPTNGVDKYDKGKHTTSNKEMFVLPNGSIVIDTPGMREIGIESADIGKSFSDIEQLARQCKFNNCTHTNEPECAVKKAIENGILDERRLNNYRKIKREAKYQGLSARERENAKLNEMFKDIGGMKKVKRYKSKLHKF